MISWIDASLNVGSQVMRSGNLGLVTHPPFVAWRDAGDAYITPTPLV